MRIIATLGEHAEEGIVNVQQGVYQIDDPLKKDEYSYVSPKEIISSFGKEKWAAFESEKLTIE